ncbi:MAG TPA: DUF4097 family beta strand repeat-containing protein [Bryobacteraceae bacterium]|nr:DUF4097 family beta strand repeat-containing protein [Bryobacteraceae bacterium]
MRKPALSFVLAAAVAALLAAQNDAPPVRENGYWTRTVQGSINTSGMERLRVVTTGSVRLHGTGDSQASYVIKLRVRATDAREAQRLLDQVNVKTGTEGGWTYIRITPPRRVSSGAGLDLTVTGPRTLRDVRVETLGGDVEASGWDGGFEARSAGGRVAIDGIGGSSEVRTAGGDIQVGTVGGDLRCSSGGGGIRVQKAGGAMWLETGGGEIVVHEAGGDVHAETGGGNIRIDRAVGTVLARTAGGLIQVQQAGGMVTAETSGGAIQVDSAKGVRCESAGGAIRLRNVSGALHASANSGSILAQLVANQPLGNSLLSTNAGDITVFIPSNLALTIQATNETGGPGRIVSDFAQVRPQNGGLAGVGPAVAQGELNGGGPLLRLNAMGGTIYLRRQR